MAKYEERWSVDKLEGCSNWMTWKFQMKHLLLGKGLWGYIDGSETLGAQANDEQRSAHNRRGQIALSTIVMGISAGQLYLVTSCETAKEAWDTLKSNFERETLANKLFLKKQYFRSEMSEGTSVRNHLRHMKELTDKLSAIGSPISEEDQVVSLLGSLPQSYSALVTALEARVDNLDLTYVQQALLHEEQKRSDCSTDKKAGESALMSKPKKSRKAIKCYGCGEKGHKKPDCPNKKRTKEEHKAKTAEDNCPDDAFTASVTSVTGKQTDQWIIDSGASRHMTKDAKWLRDYQKFEQPELVGLGDGRCVAAIGIGNAYLNMTFKVSAPKEIVMYNVLHVPDLACNLFSVRAATSKGNVIQFTDSRCYIRNSKGGLCGMGSIKGKLYYLSCEVVPGDQASVASECYDLWHQRLGHINKQQLMEIVQKDMATGISVSKQESVSICEGCIKGKMNRQPFKAVGEIRSKKPLEVVHSDVCGPMRTESIGGSRYFVTFTDDFTRLCVVHFVRQKSDVLAKFKEYKAYAENKLGYKIGALRCDNGGEYMSNAFRSYLKENGISSEVTTPHTPEQNGVAERMNRTLIESAKAMLSHSGMPNKFWAEAVATAAYTRNRRPTRALKDNVTPYEKWYGRKPNLSNLRVFGCVAFAHIPEVERGKLDEKAQRVRFVGYSRVSKGYRVYDEQTQKILNRRDVVFDECNFGRTKTCVEVNVPSCEQVTVDSTTVDQAVVKPVEEPRYPDRRRAPPVRYGLDEYADRAIHHEVHHVAYHAGHIEEPKTFKEAMCGDQAKQWENAADAEYQSLIDNGTWELVKLPPGRKTVGCKWVFKVKHGADGEVARFKSRLVAKGYSQSYGLDYDETFSPVVRFSSIRALLAFAIQKGMLIHQMDVTTAFLNGKLEEDVFMDQPEGYIIPGKEDLVCHLKRSIYGLKQSPRCWNKELVDYLTELGFIQSDGDPCVFVRTVNDKLVIIAVYVDDLILATEDSTDMCDLKKALSNCFKMKDLGMLHYCLGIEITQESDCVKLTQKQYILKLLKKYGMSDANTVSTPSDRNVKLIKDDGVSGKVDKSMYQSMVGSLLYAAVATRPDIGQSVSMVSKFSSDPTMAHLTAVKRILRYLKGTVDLGLTYSKSDGNVLKAYSDSDWAGDQDDRHSTSGFVSVLSGSAISWLSKKQASVALSTAEAEYIALSTTTQEVVWLRRLLRDFGVDMSQATEVFGDNQGSIALSKNPVHHKRTKHIDIRYHFVREAVVDGIVKITYCPTKEMVADILTKPLPRGQFEILRSKLGLS
jgi:hypothetical protein